MREIFGVLRFYGIFDAVPLALAATAIYAAIRVVYLRKGKRQRADICAELARGLLVWYLATLVVVVWFPYLPGLIFGKLSLADFITETFYFGEYANNGRFWNMLNGRYSIFRDFELLSNIELFVPYGILLPIAFRRLKWWAVDLISLGTTAVIELIQPFFGRSCDVDDIIANTLGAVVGCALAKLIVMTVARIRKH